MTTKDKQGRDYAKLSELKAGDTVEVDGDFTCLKPWTKHMIATDDGGMFIPCSDGKHHLSNQADDGVHCIGIYRA